MEEDNFINLLVKNLQMLCHDHLPFKQSLEVTGHVCIHIDAGVNLNLFLNEKCNKVNTSSVFSSLSFQAPSLLPADNDLSENPEERLLSVKESVFAKKNANKRLFIDGSVDNLNSKSTEVKKIGKPNYSKHLSPRTPSSIIVQVKKVPRSIADKIDENEETSVAVVQDQPFILPSVIVNQEHLTQSESDISVKQSVIQKYGETVLVKDEILDEGMVDEADYHIVKEDVHKSLQDEDDMEHVERMQANHGQEDCMIDDADSVNIHNDDDDYEDAAAEEDDDDDDKTADHDYGETSITHSEEDDRVPELPGANNYFDQKELDDGIEYTIVDMATKKGRPMLIDNIGFGYNIRRNTDKTVHWTCSLRNKQISCAAGVLQCNDNFKRNKHQHCHPPKPGLLTSTIIVAEARAQANNDPVTPTSLVVQRAMTVKGKSEDETFLPRTSNLKRMINRYRQCKREGGLPKKKARVDFVKFETMENESQ